MKRNTSTTLSDLTFEDIMSEAEAEYTPASAPRATTHHYRNTDSNRDPHSDVKFSILKNYGKLSNRNGAPSFTLVDWNGYKRYDLRGWNDDYTVPFKGISFSEEELQTLADMLTQYSPTSYSMPKYTSEMGKTTAKIYHVVCELSSSTIRGVTWNKQIAIVDWGYGQKYDFRKWTTDYDRCSKGICLNQGEIDNLLRIADDLVG